jgi:hexosaminidase
VLRFAHQLLGAIVSLVVLTTCLTVRTCPGGTSQTPSLVPFPRELAMRGASTSLSSSWRVVVATNDSADDYAANLLVNEVNDCFGWKWRTGRGAPSTRTIAIEGVFDTTRQLMTEQGYRLSITPDHIRIAAASAAGRFYGVQTLRQILRGVRDGRVPCAEIADYPSLKWRGVSDDISRGQISTLDDFKAIIRRLAYYKINLYQPYIEDAFVFRTDPNIGSGRGRLSPQELSEIVREGQRNHVTVIPIFQTLGHQERLLALPENRRYAEIGGKTDAPLAVRALRRVAEGFAFVFGKRTEAASSVAPSTFSPVLPSTRGFVISLLDEVAAASAGAFLHIGGDEAPDLGKGTSKTAADRIGVGEVYTDYVQAISQHLAVRHHMRTMLFGDVLLAHPEAMKNLSRDIVIVDWHYDPPDTFASLQTFRAAGFTDVVGSAGLWNWFGIYPNYESAFPNIASATTACRRESAVGSLVASWGDGGGESLRETNWPGYAFLAASAWQSIPPDEGTFLTRFASTEFGTRSQDLAKAERLVGWQSFPTLGWNQLLYHRPPRLRRHTPAWLQRMSRLRSDMITASSLVAAARPSARFNSGELACLSLGAQKFLFAADRELTLEELARRLGTKTSSELSPSARDSVATALHSLAEELEGLTDDYKRCWLLYNRPPMLADIERRMQEQAIALRALASRATAGTLRPEDPTGMVVSQ